jgi:hypothetical protein
LKTKVCIFCVYIGKLPINISHWIISAKFNKNYDWYIFTNDIDRVKVDKNIKFIPISLSSYIDDIKNKLNVEEVNIQTLNRVADFKVMYGHLFEDIAKNYDWWGWTDLDVMYGNFDEFLNDEVYSSNEIIGYISNSGILFGPFCLLSNNLKKLYTEVDDYKKMLSNGNPSFRQHASLIEEIALGRIIKQKNIKVYMQTKDKEILIKNEADRYPLIWDNGNLILKNLNSKNFMKNTIVVHLKKNFKGIESLNTDKTKFIIL